MFNYIKNTFTNFASYMLGLNKQLANAKNDAERVKILTQIVEVQRKRIDELDEENAKLKEEIKTKTQTDLTNLRSKVLKLKSSVNNLQEAVIEIPPKN